MKDPHIQNHCILMKFAHKVLQDEPLPWKNWILNQTQVDLGDPEMSNSYLGKKIYDELQNYHALTKVKVHNGISMAFWMSSLLPLGPLFVALPDLFSHTTRPNVVTVQQALSS